MIGVQQAKALQDGLGFAGSVLPRNIKTEAQERNTFQDTLPHHGVATAVVSGDPAKAGPFIVASE